MIQYGKGGFVRLRDGSILHAYTEYYGESGENNATARIAYYHSEGDAFPLRATKITKILFDELEG